MAHGSQGCSEQADPCAAEFPHEFVSLISSCLERERALQAKLLHQKLQEERDSTQRALDAIAKRLDDDRRERQSALDKLSIALAEERAAWGVQLSSLRHELSVLQAGSEAPLVGCGGEESGASSAAHVDTQLRRMEDLVAAERASRKAGLSSLHERLLQEIAASTRSLNGGKDSTAGNRITAAESPLGRSGEASHAIGTSVPMGVGQSPEPVLLMAGRQEQSGTLENERAGGDLQVRFDLRPQHTVSYGLSHMVGNTNVVARGASASSMLSPQAPRAGPSAAAHPLVTSTMLDRGGMYVPKLSLWDVMLFVGHDSLGPSVSSVISIIWLLNFTLQTTFIAIVYGHMLEESVSDDMLQGLLQFRLGPAHSIEFADRVTQRSLAAQVCEHDFKLPVAGGQEGLLDTIRDFSGGGIILSILATILWLMTVMQDLQGTANYMQALLSVRRGSYTSLRFVDSDNLGDEGLNSRRTAQTIHSRSSADESLITLIKVARVTRLSSMRIVFVFFSVVIPKLFIGCVAGIVGAVWLAHTNVLADLVLNAVALAFVLDIDDVIFSIFVPRRARTLMANLEPLPLPARKSLTSKCPVLNSICKMCLLFAGSWPIFMMVLFPAYNKQQRVISILCSGNLDFVYATNPATDMVYVTKSSRSSAWTYSELAVLQAAQVEIDDEWGYDGEIHEALQSITTALVLPSAPTLTEAEQTEDGFPFILEVSQWSVGEAARVLPCRDLASAQSEEAAVWKLRDLFKDTDLTINRCEDIPRYFCSKRQMTELRAICPNHCECDRPRASTGFFETPSFGCPTQCESFKAAFNEIQFRFRQIGSFPLQCEDYPHEQLGIVGSCVDDDRDRFDVFGDACDPWYTDQPDQCGVGNTTVHKFFFGAFDDEDFTASLLCCACGGGNMNITITPAECFRDFTDDCHQLPQDVISWVLYVRGMWEALSSRFAYNESVALVVNSGLLGQNVTDSQEFNLRLIESVTSGQLAENIASGNWSIMDDLGHPRNLSGCEFLTSNEIRALLNMDLCFPAEDFTPLGFFCPVSCGCDHSSSLSMCPAACVLDSFEDGFSHPWFGGDGSKRPSRYEELPFPAPFNDPTYVELLPDEIARWFRTPTPAPGNSSSPSPFDLVSFISGISPSPSFDLQAYTQAYLDESSIAFTWPPTPSPHPTPSSR